MSSIRDLDDVNFTGIVNKDLIVYDASTNTFVPRNMDNVLSSPQVLDGDLPDDFITQIEDEVNISNMNLTSVDGGDF